jgi:hypothetical protein
MSYFYSDAKQDQFTANILQFKKNGYCVDIGSCHSMVSNNTYFFQNLDWASITVEIESSYNESYLARKKGNHLNANALELNYADVFEKYKFPENIDYLSLDVDTISLDVLKILPFKKYSFKVITIEHDAYLYGDKYREQQRSILSSKGYTLLCSNVYVEQSGHEGKKFAFEDWWVNPDNFSKEILNKLSSENEYPSNIIKKFNI